MKKQLLAAAVAAAVAVPMTATAGDVTLYGVLHYSIDNLDNDTGNSKPGGTDWDDSITDNSTLHVNSHYSRFGIKGTEDLGNGLSAFFQMEFHLHADDGQDGYDVRNNRNTFVGLAGNWGKVGIGRNDSPYKKSTSSLELFSLIQGDYNGIGFHDLRMNDTIFYYSPNWNGFSFGAAIGVPSDDEYAMADGVEIVSLAATYKNGPWFASLAHEGYSDEHAYNETTPEDKWRLGLGYTANGFHVGFIYEERDDIEADSDWDADSWQLSASYTFGNNVIKAAYGEEDDDYYGDAELFSIGLDHKLSKRTKVYAAYADYDADEHDGYDYDYDSFGVGIVHKF